MKTILLIEDSKFLRIANERILKRAGYDVIGAADGEEALCSAWRHRPDLVLLDLLLPKLGGLELLQLFRQHPKTADIPIVVLTSLSQTNAEKLLQAGAAAFLQKENTLERPELLLQQLAAVLGQPTVPAARVSMRGDLGVRWENRSRAGEPPSYRLEFLPEAKEGLGSRTYAVKGAGALEDHLRQFDIGRSFLQSWLTKLAQEDILIPYVGITPELSSLYGLQ